MCECYKHARANEIKQVRRRFVLPVNHFRQLSKTFVRSVTPPHFGVSMFPKVSIYERDMRAEVKFISQQSETFVTSRVGAPIYL